MGYMRRHAIVVTGNPKAIKRAHDAAVEIFGRDAKLEGSPPWKGEFGAEMVSSIVGGVMNDDASFFIGPDGSKEGWEHSHEGDRRRAEFIAWLRKDEDKNVYTDGGCYWVELFYADDSGECAIVDHSGEDE